MGAIRIQLERVLLHRIISVHRLLLSPGRRRFLQFNCNSFVRLSLIRRFNSQTRSYRWFFRLSWWPLKTLVLVKSRLLWWNLLLVTIWIHILETIPDIWKRCSLLFAVLLHSLILSRLPSFINLKHISLRWSLDFIMSVITLVAHWSFCSLSSMGVLPLTTILFSLLTLALDLGLRHHLSLALSRLMELVNTIKWCITFSSLWIPVIEIQRLFISEIKRLNSLAHSSLFICGGVLVLHHVLTLVLLMVTLHLLMNLQHNLIIRTIRLVFGAFSRLRRSLDITIRLSSCWAGLMSTYVCSLVLGVYNKLIINLLSLGLVNIVSLVRSSLSLIGILGLRQLLRKVFFILLLSLVELHLHILLEGANWFVALVMLIGGNWNLIRPLNKSVCLLIFLNAILLRVASLVASQIHLFKFVINFIVLDDLSDDFSNVLFISQSFEYSGNTI